ncbi:MAG: hypothetical protein AAFR35_05510 [Pseudomonadota bacterium]
MRIVFHLGVHKTASTTIQTALAEASDALADRGIFYANTRFPNLLVRQREHLRRLQSPGRDDPAPDALRKVNRRLLRDAAGAGAHTILISEENRLGHPLYREVADGRRPARFYPRAEDCLRRVLVGLDDTPTTLLLVTREFHSLLPSLYSEGLTNLLISETLDEFCAAVDFATLDFAALCERIRAAAPEAGLVTHPFEGIRAGSANFLRDLFSKAGLELGDLDLSDTHVRGGLDRHQSEDIRALVADPDMSPRRRRQRLAAIRSRARDPEARLSLPDWALERLAAASGAADVDPGARRS